MQVLNAKEERVLKQLKELGLSEYEGKAYFSALVLGRAKAGELSRCSAVPQSKIYYVLERLEDKGFVEIEGRPKYVKAVEIGEAAERMIKFRERQIENIRKAKNELEEIARTVSLLIGKNDSRYLRLFKPKYTLKI